MAKSLFDNLKVTDKMESPPPHQKPSKEKRIASASDGYRGKTSPKGPRGKAGKPGEQRQYKYAVQYEFESRDQAIAIARILIYQSDRLREQADKHDKNKLTYISEMLRDQADIIEGMADKIRSAVPD
jgi:hypothetical protein